MLVVVAAELRVRERQQRQPRALQHGVFGIVSNGGLLHGECRAVVMGVL